MDAHCVREQDPESVNVILDAIQSISDEARRLLADPELPRAQILSALSVCVHTCSLVSSWPDLFPLGVDRREP
jgi:hypothetical protein